MPVPGHGARLLSSGIARVFNGERSEPAIFFLGLTD